MNRGLLTLAEYHPHGGNCRNEPDQGEGSSNGLPFPSELISEEEGDPCAKKSTRNDDKREFWPGKFDLFHDRTNRLVREDGQTEECHPGAHASNLRRSWRLYQSPCSTRIV